LKSNITTLLPPLTLLPVLVNTDKVSEISNR
jgi:hypothetical protein